MLSPSPVPPGFAGNQRAGLGDFFWAWGYNGNGELGNGTQTSSLTPVQVSGITNAVAIAAGDRFSLAALADGTVRAWGKNDSGNLETVRPPRGRRR